MKMIEIRKIAKEMNLKSGGMKKVDLIKAIQAAEGNSSCFGSTSGAGNCDQGECCWRSDCLNC